MHGFGMGELARTSQDSSALGSQAPSEQAHPSHICFYADDEDDKFLVNGFLIEQHKSKSSSSSDAPATTSKCGQTALIQAAKEGDADLVVDLLDQDRTQLNKPDVFGWTGLHFAASLGHPEVLEVMLDKGAYVDHPNHDGATPLHLAVFHRRLSAVQVLLDHGARIHNTNGVSPWRMARDSGDAVLLRLLEQHGAHA